MRKLCTENVEDIATGAAVLGTGGGGDPHVGKLMAKQGIKKHGPINLLNPGEVPDDALVIPSAMMGAPTVMLEKIPEGSEALEAFQALECYTGKEAYATMSIEAGGLNSTVPLGIAAALNIPVIDADAMGRAFPEIPQTTLTLGDIDATPMAMADEKGNSVLLETIDNARTERFSRSISIDMGGSAMIAIYSHAGAQLKKHAIHGSLTYAEEIGQTIRQMSTTDRRPIDVLVDEFDGFHLFSGKVTDVYRRTTEGFANGKATIEGLDVFNGDELTLQFQNEFLIAKTENEILATTPDLISVIETETGDPVTTEELKYGYRVDILGLRCADPWRTEEGIQLGGPPFFNYDTEYVPIEQRVQTNNTTRGNQ